MKREDLIKSDDYIIASVECIIRSRISVIKMRKQMSDFIIGLKNELVLLKHDESKQPQPPDCANTMLGEVPHGVNDQPGENLKAVEGATPVVRQNEQTKKDCRTCKYENYSLGEEPCFSCFMYNAWTAI